jgi:hypothetical protein
MTLHVSRMPFSLDPLMAEAKRRARRRRLLLALSVAAGAVAATTFALHSGGGPGGTPSSKSDAWPSHETAVADRPSGIQVIHEGPLASVNMMVNNMWQGQVGGRWLLAYAGTWNKSPNTVAGDYEPAVILYTEPINPNAPKQYLRRIGVYPAPGSASRISAADGNVLRLAGIGASSTEQSFRFNLATRAYSP